MNDDDLFPDADEWRNKIRWATVVLLLGTGIVIGGLYAARLVMMGVFG